MGKLGCVCGNVISDVVCPNEVTGWLLSDKSGEEFFNQIDSVIDDYLKHAAAGNTDQWRQKYFNELYPNDVSAGGMIHDVLTSKFFELTLSAMECDECGRLMIQQKPDVNKYDGYQPDNSDSRNKMLGYNKAAEQTSPVNRGITND